MLGLYEPDKNNTTVRNISKNRNEMTATQKS